MIELTKCPECGSISLKQIDEPMAMFECQNKRCFKRFGRFDYIFAALKSYDHKINLDKLFDLCFEGVNKV